jgi:nucleotide-binding universal stress UspA family protein
MYKRILIAIDGSELAGKGLEQGLELAAALGAAVIVLTVSEPLQSVDAGQVWGGSAGALETYRLHVKAQADGILGAAEKRARALGVACESVHVPERYPADAILETAGARQAELIVMASHGRRGLGRLLIGSQTNAVITHSKVPVLVVR